MVGHLETPVGPPDRKDPHPALFGILVLPFGAAVGFLQVAPHAYKISSVTWLDGHASGHWGTRGSVAFDGAITGVGIAILIAMVLIARRQPRGEPVAGQFD